MSKIYNKYLSLKSSDFNMFYIFNSGLFYVFIDEDAKKISQLLGLKLTNLNSQVLKCGFPTNQIVKYSDLLSEKNIDFTIIENDYTTVKNSEQYIDDIARSNIIKQISNINTDTMTPYQALNMIVKLKENISGIY